MKVYTEFMAKDPLLGGIITLVGGIIILIIALFIIVRIMMAINEKLSSISSATSKKKNIRKGTKGEKEVRHILNKLDSRYTVYNDLMFKTQRGTTQIDHLVVSKYGIFVIETKNYTGILTGKETDEEINLYVGNYSKKIYNPMKQNRAHIKALMNVFGIYESDKYYPILAVAPTCNAMVYSVSDISQFSQLNKTIHSHTFVKLSAKEIKKICGIIEEKNITDKKQRKEHIKYAQRAAYFSKANAV